MPRITTLAALIAAAALAAPTARADDTKTGNAKAAPVNDRLFAEAAAAAGAAEIAASTIALKNGGDDARKFAQNMIDDHSKANTQLMTLARAKGIALPTTMSYQDTAVGDILGGLKGEEFDREYLKQQHAAHMCAVQLFTAEAERGQDADIRAFATKTLPTLKQHLKMAMEECEKCEKDDKSKSSK